MSKRKKVDSETKGIDLGTKGRKVKQTVVTKPITPMPIFKPVLNVDIDIKEIADE